jgi:hypothetical protein
MKRLIPFALIALALAAVPIALGDNGTTTTPTTTSTTPTTQTQTSGTPAGRFDKLRLRVQRVETRFAAHCGSSSTSAPQACIAFAQKVEQRLQTLDTNLQARIAKIQQACSSSTSTSTDRCTKAPERIAQLQTIDSSVQALVAKVQGWLGGASSSSSTNDATLGQAAAGLGQLTQQAGGNG